jgi:hypothetical protein
MGWTCGTNGVGYERIYISLGKLEGRRPIERPRYRWVDITQMDLRGVGRGSTDWIGLVQGRDWRRAVSTIMNL